MDIYNPHGDTIAEDVRLWKWIMKCDECGKMLREYPGCLLIHADILPRRIKKAHYRGHRLKLPGKKYASYGEYRSSVINRL